MVRDRDGSFVKTLVKHDAPILRIPTLAIHLDRQETFSFNKETQLLPIAGMIEAELNRQGKSPEAEKPVQDSDAPKTDSPFTPIKALNERHHPALVDLIASEAGVDSSSIMDFELVLYDTQKAVLGGINGELIFSARLDNLMMSYCSLTGLIHSVSSTSALDKESTIRLIALFDHEEIGSQTAQGADSNLLPAVIRRLSVLPSSESDSDPGYDKVASGDIDAATAYEQTLSTSFLISADMAHSVHPNYSAKYESDHRPEMNKGTVIKVNANARYATNSPGIVLLQEVARRAKALSTRTASWSGETEPGVPLQLFVVRNDSSCGSTIGPMLSAALGARTLDLGNPQLSMHSIRETAGAYDVETAVNLFESFFDHFAELESKIFVD